MSHQCDTDLIEAAIEDRLSDQQSETLRSHLRGCQKCRRRLEHAAAPPRWWDDAQRLLDLAVLDDPSADVADSSTADARVFEADDPVGELKAAGVIDAPAHPEMLGKLGRYSIEREIGTGGMGTVYRARKLDAAGVTRDLALKRIRSGADADSKEVDEPLPDIIRIRLPSGTIAVEHGHRHGHVQPEHRKLIAAHPDARAIIYGHTHKQLIDQAQTPWILNPGAAGHIRNHGGPKCMVLHVDVEQWRAIPHNFQVECPEAVPALC